MHNILFGRFYYDRDFKCSVCKSDQWASIRIYPGESTLTKCGSCTSVTYETIEHKLRRTKI